MALGSSGSRSPVAGLRRRQHEKQLPMVDEDEVKFKVQFECRSFVDVTSVRTLFPWSSLISVPKLIR